MCLSMLNTFFSVYSFTSSESHDAAMTGSTVRWISSRGQRSKEEAGQSILRRLRDGQLLVELWFGLGARR